MLEGSFALWYTKSGIFWMHFIYIVALKSMPKYDAEKKAAVIARIAEVGVHQWRNEEKLRQLSLSG